MVQANILIISDDPAVSRAVTSRWRGESDLPAFTVLGSDPHGGLDNEAFDLAVVAGVKPVAMRAVLRTLSASGKPALIVVDDNSMSAMIKQELPRAVLLHRGEGWSDSLVIVGGEILARIEADHRMRDAEAARASHEREAALGRYMLEMRHGLNNALTSILGNSELLLLDPADLQPSMISQLGTIRTMALRIHETIQRFSSLEKEMTFVERQAVNDVPLRQTAGACD